MEGLGVVRYEKFNQRWTYLSVAAVLLLGLTGARSTFAKTQAPQSGSGSVQSQVVTIEKVSLYSPGAKVELTRNSSPGGSRSEPAKEGMNLGVGDRIKTDAQSSVRLAYPKGSKVFVGRSSELKVTFEEGQIPGVALEEGIVRTQVLPKKDKSKFKFLIRTQAMVMGVRGTNFVVDSLENGKKASLHTLEGEVTVSEKMETLSYDGRGVVKEQMIEGVRGGPLSDARPFELDEYLAKLIQQEPGLKAEPIAEPSPSPAPEPSPGSLLKTPREIKPRVEGDLKKGAARADEYLTE